MAKSTRALGRNRPIDVGLPPGILTEFIRRCGNAFGRDSEQFIGSDQSVIPGSPVSGDTMVSGRFAVDYLWREFLSKYDDGKSSVEKERIAMEKFAEGEVQCGWTNARLSRMVGLPVDLAESDIERTMCVARRKIREILGKFSWDHAHRGFGFSTGASTRCKRVASTVPHKYSGTPETTYSNANLAAAAIATVPAWKRSLTSEIGPLHLKLVEGNCITTVPKNYKTNRVIAIEPDMNMYVQKGLGSLIRERLKAAGNNLKYQDTNQDLAFYGSSSGRLATIDLKMASDTVALELVRFLLPTPWCAALELCRSTCGILPDGSKVYYRKFSSMGNGYTFELESLIFLGLSLAVCEILGLETHLVSVYGDDIVVPTEAAGLLTEVLLYCGFQTNEDKTFVSGPFRESCGKHYFYGRDVQPFYIKNDVQKLSDLFLLHNKLYRWQTRQQWNDHVDHEQLNAVRAWLRAQAPSNWRKPRIPDGYGDGAFLGTFDECTPKRACTYVPGRNKPGKRDGYEGYIATVLLTSAVVADFHECGYSLPDPSREKDWSPADVFITGMSKPRKTLKAHVPALVGRLLQSLEGVGRADLLVQSTPFEGGVFLSTRPRVSNILVDGYC